MGVWNPIFHNRTEAGEILAKRLHKYAGRSDVIVLAVPRGGLPVGAVVARDLRAPLGVLVVHRLCITNRDERTVGALAGGGARILDGPLIAKLKVTENEIDAVTLTADAEIRRRKRFYLDGRPEPALRGATVILVDDGIASGVTMRAAIAEVRQRQASRIVVAVPTIARSTYNEIHGMADEWIDILVPERFESVGEWYEEFRVTTDEEVRTLLIPGDEQSASNGPEKPRRRGALRGRAVRS